MVDESDWDRDPKRFRLVRESDPTGVSGEGIVAVGCLFPSGTAIIEWLNEDNPNVDTTQNGLAIKPGPDGLKDTVEIHGHGGSTKIEMVDDDVPMDALAPTGLVTPGTEISEQVCTCGADEACHLCGGE